MAFRKLVGSYKDYNLATHIIESGYLAVDVDTGSLRIGDGSTPGGTVIATPSGGGSQNVFQTIAVSGQSNVVADSTTDTLTLVAGTNVTLTTDASADTITINSSGGGGGSTDLNSLSAGVIDTQNDSIGFIDANDSNNSKKETITDFLTAIAGSGISVSSGQLTASGGGGGGTGDVSFVGATISAPSNAPLTITSSGSSVDIEGISIAGTVLSTTDSSIGIEITGNLIPSADSVYQLGSSSRRWQTAYLSAGTLDIGGATISSDGTGSISIAATGATLPAGSKAGTQTIMLGGKTPKTAIRPIQLVPIFVSDGSTTFTDAQLLAKTANLELEFNGTVEEVPVYTEAQQTFTLANGQTLSAVYTANITQFQF